MQKNNHLAPGFRTGIRRTLYPLFVCFGLWAGIPSAAPAQAASAVAWEPVVYYGTLWRHTPKLTIRSGQPVFGQEINLRFQTRGARAWHGWQRFPIFGIAGAHFRLGAQAHGDAWALLPNLTVPILRRGRWLAAFRVGTGLGYVTRPYDAFDNPGQNAIGSHWNNFTQFRLGAEYRLGDHWRVQAGACLSHFSNGATTLPNFGVNLPGGYLAVAGSVQSIRETDFVQPAESKRATRRWGGLAAGSLALVEYSVFDGPRYPVWGLSGAGYYAFNRVNRLLLGVDYEFHRGVYAWGLRSAGFRTKPEAQRGATRLALTLADEFLFGAIGIQVLAGVYTGAGFNRYVSHPWYSKLTTRYYLPPLLHTPLRAHVGIVLKAHRTTAEFISLNLGLVY